MEKKITALKTAYRAGNRDALIKAARAVVAYDRKHPFAMLVDSERAAIVQLARKIAQA
jgi:hypothetical protein